MLLSIILLIVGFTLLVKGADFFVEGASALALKLKIPQIIIGLTIVAMGTSAPEAGVSITSAIKGIEGITIGNVIGSNIANVLLILGVTGVITALPIKKNTIKYEIPFTCFISGLMLLMGYYFHYITRLCAIVFILLFIVFLIYLLKIAKNVEEVSESASKLSVIKIILFIIIGILGLIYGSDFTVNSAIDIAHRIGVSDRIIGLTIVAIGTSLPELVTCAIAGIKKQADLAIGNIVGSNIFNILFVLGLTGIIKPIKFDSAFYTDGLIMLFSIMLLFVYTVKKQRLSRLQGISFLLFYIAYMIFAVTK